MTNLKQREVMVDKNREPSNRDNQEFHSEAVMVAVVCGLELHVDQVDSGKGTANVDHLRKRDTTSSILYVFFTFRGMGQKMSLKHLPSCLCCIGR